MAGGGTSPSALDRPNYEDGGFKIGRYTMEERKIRIHRYQQKRTQRNFNKKIKVCFARTSEKCPLLLLVVSVSTSLLRHNM